MGVVYRALDPRSGRRVALKLLLNTDERFRARFGRESRALARLNHPNVVRVHAAGEERGAPYLVMELVEGRSLQELVRTGPLEAREAAELLAQVARGAGHAHAQGIVHRDIKPDNVLVRPNGRAILTDFGLARDVAVSSDLSKTGIFLGTPGYASPEQAAGEGKHVGPASDVYGLGALLFALLCGRAPWEGTLLEIVVSTISEAPPSPRAENPAVDPSLDALCQRCLAKDPDARYPDGDALAEALEAYLRGELEAPRRSRAGFALAGLAAALGLGCAALYAASREAPPQVASPQPPSETPTPSASPSPSPSGPKPSRALARAIRRGETAREGRELDAAIELFLGALERAGPAGNRAEAEEALAKLYTRRSQSMLRRSPAESVADLRAARALADSLARREALSAALLRRAMVLGGTMAKGLEWAGAKECYREAMELTPRDPRPALQLGVQARARKDWETCVSANLEAARRAPDDVRPQVQLARALLRLERGAEARAGLKRFLGEHPEARPAWAELGELERAAGRWHAARQAYEQAGGAEGGDPRVQEGLAYVSLEEVRPRLALKLADRAAGRGLPQRLAPVRALAHHRAGDSAKALSYFEAAWGLEEARPWLCDLALGHLEALRNTKGDAEARLRFYLQDGRLDRHGRLVVELIQNGSSGKHEGSNALLKQIQLLPRGELNPRADCALSEWLTRWGTYDIPQLAAQLAQRAAQASADDEDGAALVLLGRALMRMGRHDQAWGALDAALRQHPTRADLHHIRAELGGSSGRFELGVESGLRCRELRSTNAFTEVYTSWCLLGAGRPEEALPLLDVAERALGDHVSGLRALARACAGELEGAEADLELALAKDPKSSGARLAAAELQLRRGAREEARRALEELQKGELYRFERAVLERALARAKGR